MNSARTTSNGIFIVILAALAVPVAGQLMGPSVLENTWNLSHWRILPLGYIIAWAVVAVALIGAAWFFAERSATLASTRGRAVGGMLVLFILFLLCQFDSFAYGGGNLRVAQMAQAETIVFRWYEFGATAFISLPYQAYKSFGLDPNTASVFAWKTYAFLCTALTFAGAAFLVRLITDDAARRVWAFLMIIFGAQTFSLLGLIGVEPLLPAVTIWVLAFAYKYHLSGTAKYLGFMWGVVIVSALCFAGTLYMIPTAVFATLVRPGKANFRPALLLSLLIMIIGVIALYVIASRIPIVAEHLLMLHGKRPFTDYSLFSGRHIRDLQQMRLVLAPIIVGALILWLWKIRLQTNFLIALAFVGALGGIVVSSILDPVNSVAADLPNMKAYYLPVSVFGMAVYLWLSQKTGDTRILSTSAMVAFLCIAAVAPSFLKINYAEPFLTSYFEKNPKFFRTGGIALRDNFFYLHRFDRANYWDQHLEVLSDDYLNYRGCLDLAATGKASDAAPILARTVAANPYWTEPRSLLSICYIDLSRPSAAKPHIDTCLMLEPYNKEHLMDMYHYYFATGNRSGAAAYLDYIRHYFPYSPDVASEVMMTWLADGRLEQADSIANIVIARDSMLSLPYLAKGRIADAARDTATAIIWYEKFLLWGKYRPEASGVAKRLHELRAQPAATSSQP